MPSTKKRINLTVPDNIYEMLQKYKHENGLTSDATACLQLVVQQLKAQENGKAFFNFMGAVPRDLYMQGVQEGYDYLQTTLNSIINSKADNDK